MNSANAANDASARIGPDGATPARSALDLVVFTLSGRLFALRARDVRELLRAVAIAPLPRAPAILEGVINLRGRIIPVLDARQRFGLPEKPLSPSDHLIVADAGDRLVALRADRAVDLVRVALRDVESAGVVAEVPYIAGIAKLESGLVLIHDLRTFLAPSEVTAIDAATRETPA
jgi:purine-binding chemotaxis protein CheW